MNDDKAELERRRERGRLAQSAFRRRQAQAKETMQEENAILKRAIRAIASEVQAGDRPALRNKIQEAATLAGLGPVGQSISSSAVGNRGDSAFTPVQPQDRRSGGFRSRGALSAADPTQAVSRKTSGSAAERGRDLATQHNSHTTIRRDPFQCYRCTSAPATILPFLGAGAFTFGGRIFWHLVEKLEAVEHNQGSTHLPERPVASTRPHPQFRDLLDQVVSLQNINPAHWVAMIEARLTYRKQEYTHEILADTSSADLLPETLVGQNTALRDKSTLSWLSPVSAERRTRAIVGDEVFALLVRPALDRWETNPKNYAAQDRTELVDGFLDRLSETYVCFEDGPRWDTETFDTVLRDWCSSIIVG